jgi:monoamine oxidase
VSLLWVLYQMASGGGPDFVVSSKDGAQDSRPVGGMGAIYRPMAAELGDAVALSQPVRRIAQDADGVTVRSDDLTVRARRVVVAVPLAIAGQISYEPTLPIDRSYLNQRMPSGAIFKISVVYDEPFWRADGLSGQTASPGSLATLTIDACTDTGTPGSCASSPKARPPVGWGDLRKRIAERRSWVRWSTGSAPMPARRSATTNRTGVSSAIPVAG